jgi:hypothetical protein
MKDNKTTIEEAPQTDADFFSKRGIATKERIKMKPQLI